MPLGDATRPIDSLPASDLLEAVLPLGEVVTSAEHLDLEPLPRLVGSIRQFVTAQAPEMSPDAGDTLRLLTSELVTNAIIHARTPIRVGVIVSPRYIVVTVHDLDLGRSELSPELRDGGRGLEMVELLSDAWAIRKKGNGAGKTVWFRLARDDESAAAQAVDGHDEGDA